MVMNKSYNAYNTYKQQAVMTMSQGDMLTALYDALIKSLLRAQISFEMKDMTQINESLKKAQLIINHLQGTLDFNFPISNELNMLYNYFTQTIIQANIKKDPTELDAIIQLITELRETYAQADKLNRSNVVG